MATRPTDVAMTARRIFKYPLAVTAERQTIRIPAGGRIVCLHEQYGLPTLWAEIPASEVDRLDERGFLVVATGQPIPWGYSYVGTAHCGPYVWHVYEAC